MVAHLWMPVLVISVASTAWLTRVMRANLFDVLGQQFVQTARAKGVAENEGDLEARRANALHPLVMTLGTTLVGIMGGEASGVDHLQPADDRGQALLQTLIDKDTYVAATIWWSCCGPADHREPDRRSAADVDRSPSPGPGLGEFRCLQIRSPVP